MAFIRVYMDTIPMIGESSGIEHGNSKNEMEPEIRTERNVALPASS